MTTPVDVLDTLPVGIWVGRVPDGRGEYANEAFRRILGIPHAADCPIGEVPATYSVHDREGRPYPVERLPFSRVLATGAPAVVDDMVIHAPDGRRVHLRAYGQPVLDAGGAVARVIVAFIDISREVRAEADRETIENRLSFVVNHAPVVVWTADMDGVVTLSEGAGLKPLGVVSGQLVGQNLFVLYKDHAEIVAHIRRAIAGEAHSYTVGVGEAVYDTWLTPIRDAAGRQTGIAGLSHDVSERRRLEAEALQNDRMIALGTLAASVAHEINNPLTFVLGHLERARAALETGDLARVRDDLETARRGAERMASITSDLRSFSRPGNAAPSEVRPVRVLRSVLDLVGKELEARARTVLRLDETPPVLAVEAKLVQAVLNLVVNALQATEALPAGAACIELGTRLEGDEVVVEVADNGPGIPAANRTRVFEAFYSTKEIGKGTGLGLFVVRNVVRDAGGRVEVDERPGGGARFRIRLPALRPAAPAPPSPRPDLPVRTGRVWVIDDEPLVAEVLSAQLAAAGFEVRTMTDGPSALAVLLGNEEADLVFCDLMMRGMTGMAIAETLEREHPRRADRVVYMTGGAFTPEARAFLERRGSRCVDKPFDVVAEARRRIT